MAFVVGRLVGGFVGMFSFSAFANSMARYTAEQTEVIFSSVIIHLFFEFAVRIELVCDRGGSIGTRFVGGLLLRTICRTVCRSVGRGAARRGGCTIGLGSLVAVYFVLALPMAVIKDLNCTLHIGKGSRLSYSSKFVLETIWESFVIKAR